MQCAPGHQHFIVRQLHFIVLAQYTFVNEIFRMLEKVNIFFFLILAIHPDLSVGSLVQFPLDGMKIQGVIKWIGCVDGRAELLAGLELVILSLYI